MGKLGGRVASKVADAGSLAINLAGQFKSTDLALFPCRMAVLPVLTEQAVEGACLIEDGQVFISELRSLAVAEIRVTHFGSGGADPISHTISGEGVIIPANIAAVGSGATQRLALIGSQSAVARTSGRDAALIDAKSAVHSFFVVWWLGWEAEGFP